MIKKLWLFGFQNMETLVLMGLISIRVLLWRWNKVFGNKLKGCFQVCCLTPLNKNWMKPLLTNWFQQTKGWLFTQPIMKNSLEKILLLRTVAWLKMCVAAMWIMRCRLIKMKCQSGKMRAIIKLLSNHKIDFGWDN